MFNAEYFAPKLSLKTISAFSVILVSLSSQFNLFPIYSELQTKTAHNLAVVFFCGCSAAAVLYVILAIVGIYMYGSDIGEYSTILKNVGE